MPELPDVEQFKKHFEKNCLHKKISDVKAESKNLIRRVVFEDFKESLTGHHFKSVRRRGKFLIAEVEGIEEEILFHFGMTGNLHYTKQEAPKEDEDKFTRVTFEFKNGYELRWINMRKFGRIYFVKEPEKLDLIKEMGPEPLELSEKEFINLIENHSRKNIKSFLMDQRDIAGIGNIYSDEILFQTRIDPHRDIKTLNYEEKKNLYKNMKEVLEEAIKIGPPEGEFSPQHWMIPHRHQDMKCPRDDNHHLKKKTIAGRSAIYCPKCQQ